MATVEERVVRLEARGAEQQRMFTVMKETIDHLEQRMDRRFDQVDRRFEQVDRRFEQIDRRFIAIERDMSSHFRWIVGIQLTTLVAVVAALLGK